MAVDKILSLVSENKENIEDLLEAVVAAGSRFIIHTAMPHYRDTCLLQVGQQALALGQGTLEQRSMKNIILLILETRKLGDWSLIKINNVIDHWDNIILL